MANPQKEKGYVGIANDLFEAMCSVSMTDESRRVFLAIVRLTYGFNKKGDVVPLTMLAMATKIDVRHISRNLACLKARNMISRDANGYTELKKDYEAWLSTPKAAPHQVTPNGVTPHQVINITSSGDKASTSSGAIHIHGKPLFKDKPRAFFGNRVPEPPKPSAETVRLTGSLIEKTKTMKSDDPLWGQMLADLQRQGLNARLGNDPAIFREGKWLVKGGSGWVEWNESVKSNLTFTESKGYSHAEPRRFAGDADG